MCFRRLVIVAVAMSVLSAPPSRGQSPPAKPQGAAVQAAVTPTVAEGVIRGRVTSSGSSAPLRRVRIVLAVSASNLPSTVTDSQGTFELTGVPPGTYRITASRAGYLTRQYGQHRPRAAGRTVTIAGGEAVEDVDIALPRGAVLAGRISDDGGEPLAGARVEAVEFRYMRGRRVAVPARVTSTNDQGDFRLSGLETGTYQVRASSRDVWESDDGRSTWTFATTYYPGVLAADGPQPVKVATGEALEGLAFQLVAARAPHIGGTLRDAAGEPLAAQVVYLSTVTRTVGGALFSSGFGGQTRTDAQGGFEFSKLPPGEYLVGAGGPKDRVSVRVIVDQGDVRRVGLIPRRPTAASGSIASEDGTPLPFPASRLRIDPIPADPMNVLPDWGAPDPQAPKSDWTFQLSNLNGSYLFRTTGLPDEWMMKAVVLRGRNVTDTPLTIVSGEKDLDGLQIVLSRTGARIDGDLVTGDGTPAPDLTVIVFADDRARWGIASRYVRAVRPDRKGRFSVVGLPAGTYRVAARDEVSDGQWEDPEFLQGLLKESTRVELAEAAAETLTLVVGAVR